MDVDVDVDVDMGDNLFAITTVAAYAHSYWPRALKHT